MSKNNLNDHVTQNLKESIYKVLEEGPTSERNLSQFRERMASEKAERVARANELRQKNAAQEAARNTPEAIAKREEARAAAHAHNVHYDATHTSPTRIKYNPNSKASINPDGSFNISPQAQAQAQTNRDAIAAGREQDRERTARLGVPAQQGVQGFDASGRTIKPNPNFRYVNSNTTPKIEEPLQNTSTPSNIPRPATTPFIDIPRRPVTLSSTGNNNSMGSPSGELGVQSAKLGEFENKYAGKYTKSVHLQQNDTQIKIPTSQRTIPNTPQNPSDTRNDVFNFNNTPMPVNPEVIPQRNPKSSNMMRNFDLYGP